MPSHSAAGARTYKWHYQSSGTPNVNAPPFVTRRSPHSDRPRRRLVYPTEPKNFNSRGISGFNLFVQPNLVVQLIPSWQWERTNWPRYRYVMANSDTMTRLWSE